VTDIFISYAREDRTVAGQIAETLTERGYKVWWDWELIGGEVYRVRIREVIGQARKTIVLWSRASIMSAFVIDEASEAKKQGKLIPVSIDGSDPPFGFGDLHTIALDVPKLDVEALIAALEGKPPPREQELRRPQRRVGTAPIAAAALTVLVAIAGGTYWTSGKPVSQPASNGLPAPPQTEAPRAQAQRVALVIGNSAYQHLGVVHNAIRDADLVSAELERRGFKVIKEVNLTAEDMTRAIEVFETSLSVVGGVGIFYYAGSAVYVDGDDVMLPVDATADMQNRRIGNVVNLTQLRKKIKSRTTTSMRDNGHATIYSASKGEVASDGPADGNSPFTIAFVDALKYADDELGDTYRRILVAMSDGQAADPAVRKQTPNFENQLTAKFHFGRPQHDTNAGISRVLILDSCRDNPHKMTIATTR
jgi:hypothetical protein